MGTNPRSSPPPSRGKISKEEAKQVVLGMCAVSTRPMLIGVACVRLGVCWNLKETEELFDELLSEGKIRNLTNKEQTAFDLREGFVLAGVDSMR